MLFMNQTYLTRESFEFSNFSEEFWSDILKVVNKEDLCFFLQTDEKYWQQEDW